MQPLVILLVYRVAVSIFGKVKTIAFKGEQLQHFSHLRGLETVSVNHLLGEREPRVVKTFPAQSLHHGLKRLARHTTTRSAVVPTVVVSAVVISATLYRVKQNGVLKTTRRRQMQLGHRSQKRMRDW